MMLKWQIARFNNGHAEHYAVTKAGWRRSNKAYDGAFDMEVPEAHTLLARVRKAHHATYECSEPVMFQVPSVKATEVAYAVRVERTEVYRETVLISTCQGGGAAAAQASEHLQDYDWSDNELVCATTRVAAVTSMADEPLTFEAAKKFTLEYLDKHKIPERGRLYDTWKQIHPRIDMHVYTERTNSNGTWAAPDIYIYPCSRLPDGTTHTELGIR